MKYDSKSDLFFICKKSLDYLKSELYMCDLYAFKKCSGVEYFIDIGANIGLASIRASSSFEECDFFCIEPQNEPFKCLEKNSKKIKNVKLYNVCLGDGSMMVNAENKCNTNLGIQFKKDDSGNVPSLIFSEFVKSENIVLEKTYLKLDCEGCEEFLLNDVDTLSKVKYIGLEVHDSSSKLIEKLKPYFKVTVTKDKKWSKATTYFLQNSVLV